AAAFIIFILHRHPFHLHSSYFSHAASQPSTSFTQSRICHHRRRITRLAAAATSRFHRRLIKHPAAVATSHVSDLVLQLPRHSRSGLSTSLYSCHAPPSPSFSSSKRQGAEMDARKKSLKLRNKKLEEMYFFFWKKCI
ncbi:hypothetical protein PIB30_106571, partial [Stylosanthes scabra]|nr:hypothetical protein [Stylosanthes scabra]